MFTTFVTTDLVDRPPETVFTTSVDQSLLGILVRATDPDASSGSPLWSPAFLAMSFAIVTLTFALAVKLAAARSSLAIALGVPAALLAYPQTLEHYGALLLIPLLFLWTHQKELGVSPVAAILFLTAEYALVRADEGGLAFFGFALCWLTFVAIAIRVIRHPAASMPTPLATRNTTAVPSRVTIPPGVGLPPRATVPSLVAVPWRAGERLQLLRRRSVVALRAWTQHQHADGEEEGKHGEDAERHLQGLRYDRDRESRREADHGEDGPPSAARDLIIGAVQRGRKIMVVYHSKSPESRARRARGSGA